jgi:beta-glucanase (GH16 family)
VQLFRKSRGIQAASAALVTIALVIAPALTASAAPVKSHGSWDLLWQDSFSGRKGASVNDRYWNAETGNSNGGWGNKEMQYYRSSNATLDGNGHLVIAAREAPAGLECWTEEDCKWTSARLQTLDKVELTTGRVEIRVKMPTGAGLWPAFWLLGTEGDWPTNGEIDVMEFNGSEPGLAGGTVHGPSGDERGYSLNAVTELAKPSAFHTYAMEKRKNDIRFFLDGKEFARYTAADLKPGEKWVFNQPFYLVLNFAVGGTWPGTPPASVRFPQKLVVDYVRVWGRGTVAG